MKIEIRTNPNQKKQITLNSSAILSYLIGNDEKIDTMIICKNNDVELITTDKEVYEALGSIKKYDSFKLNKLTKFFENVEIESFKSITGKSKPILTFQKLEELRKNALKNKNNQIYGGIKKWQKKK